MPPADSAGCFSTKETAMKRLLLVIALASAALSGCAQLKDAYQNADAGATRAEDQRPYPKSSSDLGLF